MSPLAIRLAYGAVLVAMLAAVIWLAALLAGNGPRPVRIEPPIPCVGSYRPVEECRYG
jgi:hypothetical protein